MAEYPTILDILSSMTISISGIRPNPTLNVGMAISNDDFSSFANMDIVYQKPMDNHYSSLFEHELRNIYTPTHILTHKYLWGVKSGLLSKSWMFPVSPAVREFGNLWLCQLEVCVLFQIKNSAFSLIYAKYTISLHHSVRHSLKVRLDLSAISPLFVGRLIFATYNSIRKRYMMSFTAELPLFTHKNGKYSLN